jgi:hypothetical protein
MTQHRRSALRTFTLVLPLALTAGALPAWRVPVAQAQEAQPPLVQSAPAARPPAPTSVKVLSAVVALGGTSLLAGVVMLGYGDYQRWTLAPAAPTVMQFVRLRDQGEAIQAGGGALMVIGGAASVIGSIGLATVVPKWRRMAMLPTLTPSGLALVGGGSF